MKFRNGINIYGSIEQARIGFCSKICTACHFSRYNNEAGSNCAIFCENNPHKAAGLMGYEVIDDDAPKFKVGDVVRIIGNNSGHRFDNGMKVKICGFQEDDNDYYCKPVGYTSKLNRGWYVSEKDIERVENDDTARSIDSHKPRKPRICEILGVDVGERFVVKESDDPPRDIFSIIITESGIPEWANNPEMITTVPSKMVLYAVQHPESLIRKPMLTEVELEICKLLGAKWVSRDKVGAQRVDFWEEKPEKNFSCCYAGHDIGCTLAEKMPSVSPGDCINVEELLKNA